MSVASLNRIYSVGATLLAIPIGATAAVFMNPVAGQVGWMLQLNPGFTCAIYSAAIGSSLPNLGFGTTQPQSVLAGFSGQGFLFGGCSFQVGRLELQGPAMFYLGNTSGATVQISVLAFKGYGY